MKYLSTGTIKTFDPRGLLEIENFLYVNPEKPIFSPNGKEFRMTYDPITSLASNKAELENTWKKFDEVYATFGPRDWSRKFEKTWTYADQPYHLSYFDGFIANYIAKGSTLLPEEQMALHSIKDINDWNAREFAKRSANQTAEQSLRQMHKSRCHSAVDKQDYRQRPGPPTLVITALRMDNRSSEPEDDHCS